MRSVGEYRNLIDLRGQTHVVLGAGQGMGRETAGALAAFGATVVCADLEARRAHDVANEVGGIGVECDVTQDGAVVEVMRVATGIRQPVGGVVDIVGLVKWQPITEASTDEWSWQDSVVSGHGLRVIREAAPVLREQGWGALTYVASVSALTSAPGHGLYGMAKSALRSLVRTAAVELGPHGIRVNSVSPGATRTPRLAERAEFDNAMRENAARTPLRRVAEPSDIAAVLLFLSSGLARHVTGEDLVVDGGLHLSWPLALPSGKETSA